MTSTGRRRRFGWREADKPRPDAGEVLVKMLAIPVNAADWHSIRGKPLFSRATLGCRARRRWSWRWHEGLPGARMGRRQEDRVWALLSWPVADRS
jgi:threonine dehydrogenase-like Zn-dependent dehydrogenase